MQAEASLRAEQLRETAQQLAEAMAAHERYVIEAEARSKSEAADAVKQRSEALMQQKEALDGYAPFSALQDLDVHLAINGFASEYLTA